MYEKERRIIKEAIQKEIVKANKIIEKLENYTAITAPESSLGTVMSEQSDDDRELKKNYLRKRKLLFFLEKVDDSLFFLCENCGSIIDLERLLVMQKASLCSTCAKAA